MTSIGPYAASGVGRPSLTKALSDLNSTLNDLSIQLATGKVSQTYSGLGDGASTSLAMRTKLAQIASYQAVNTTVNTRVSLMNTTLERLDDITAEYKLTDPNEFMLTSGSVTIAQSQAAVDLKEAIAALNLDVGGRYAFSGRSTDVKPVISAEAMLADADGKSGLRTVINERKLADLGADGRGRLAVSAASGGSFSVSETGAGPFGFKISSVSSSMTNGSATGPTGTPPSATLGLTGQPNAGEQMRVGLKMPDGTTTEIVLTVKAADDTSGLNPGEFRLGADADETAANMQAAFDSALKTTASTELTAASAMQAGEEFFNVPAGSEPARVGGFDGTYATEADRIAALQSATSLDTTDTAAKTVSWYVGDNDAGDPRLTSAAKIDDGVNVAYGARANEDGPRRLVQTLAVFSSMTFSADDADAKARYSALASRTVSTLGDPKASEDIQAMSVDLAQVSTSIKAANTRHSASKVMAEDLVASVEGAPKEEVAAKILALQNQLQASYQVTANLSQLSLVNFL